MYLSLKDIINCITRSMLIVFVVVFLFFLIRVNILFANYICDITNIPRDLALTIMSPEFANEIIILSTIFEFGFMLCFLYYLSKIPVFFNIYKKIKNI